jgi:alkylation response protein AidB-like acyl-CoA dehydrogenase
MTLQAKFTPVLDEVGAEAVIRERERRQPYAEVQALRESGFTRMTLPSEYGGDGATHGEFFELLAELARRDSNLAQLLRSHFSFIDRLIHAPASAARDARLALLAGGAIHGNATFERGPAKVGEFGTRVTSDELGLRLDGRKFYSTGTLFADLVSVAAEKDGGQVSVLIRTDVDGLTRDDDWAGFGQRMTGSGTTVFDGVRIAEDDISRFDPSAPSHGGAFVQLVLLAVVTGIGRAVVDDGALFVRNRTRTYSHASGATPREDPIVQEVVGELSALSFAADGALARAVSALERSSEAIRSGLPLEEQRARIADLEIATARAQLVVLPNVLRAATDLFEVGGASATDAGLALDRHWRNARTVASHNPARYKARALGDQLINNTPVVSWWTNGEA